MAQNPLGPPPPVKQDAVFDRWIRMVYQRIASAGQLLWSQIDFTGSNITDIITRSHASLQNLTADDHTIYYPVSASRGMNGADFNRVAANPGNTDTVWMDDGTTYDAGTLVFPMVGVFLDEISFGAPGYEQGHIDVNGVAYDALVKINEYGGTRDGSLILHRHHTTNSISATAVFAKSNTNDATHAIVADGERLGEIIATGHDGTDYATSSSIRFEVDGTPGSNDMPGRIVFLTSPDGSQTIAERMRISADGKIQFGTDGVVEFDEHTTAGGTPATGKVAMYAKADGYLYSKDDAGAETQLGGGSGGGGSRAYAARH